MYPVILLEREGGQHFVRRRRVGLAAATNFTTRSNAVGVSSLT